MSNFTKCGLFFNISLPCGPHTFSKELCCGTTWLVSLWTFQPTLIFDHEWPVLTMKSKWSNPFAISMFSYCPSFRLSSHSPTLCGLPGPAKNKTKMAYGSLFTAFFTNKSPGGLNAHLNWRKLPLVHIGVCYQLEKLWRPSPWLLFT